MATAYLADHDSGEIKYAVGCDRLQLRKKLMSFAKDQTVRYRWRPWDEGYTGTLGIDASRQHLLETLNQNLT